MNYFRPLSRWNIVPPGGNFSPIIKCSKCWSSKWKTQDKQFINSYYIKIIVNYVKYLTNMFERTNYKQYFWNL